MLSRILIRLLNRFASAVVPPPNFAPSRPLDEFTRREIRDWYQLPTTKLVLGLVENTHPCRSLPAILPRNEQDKDAAVCLLNRTYGWERYRNTLLNLLTPPPTAGDIGEKYAPNE